jgi:hypothetical protein
MPVPFQSMLKDVLAQIKASKGGNPEQALSGAFRDLTGDERAARGIDPRDPNKFAVNDAGQMMSTLIGFNPNQNYGPIGDSIQGRGRGGLDFYDGGKGNADDMARKLSSGMSRQPNSSESVNAALQAAGEAGGKSNFSRPVGKLPEGMDFDSMTKNLGSKKIPKAKESMERVSPGMYRNAKGNLVRK